MMMPRQLFNTVLVAPPSSPGAFPATGGTCDEGGDTASSQATPRRAARPRHDTSIADTKSSHSTATSRVAARRRTRQVSQRQHSDAGASGPRVPSADRSPEVTAKANPRPKRGTRFSVPLGVMLGLQLLVVIAGFVVVISVTRVLITNTTLDLVKDKLRSDMAYADLAVQSPITKAETLLHELRERSVAQQALNGAPSCRPNAHGIDDSSVFFLDAGMSLLMNPTLTMLLHSTRTSATAAPALCVATQDALVTSYNGTLLATTAFPLKRQFTSLDATMAFAPPGSTTTADYVYFRFDEIVRKPTMGWTPYLSTMNVADGPHHLFLVGYMVLEANIYNPNGTVHSLTSPTDATLEASGLSGFPFLVRTSIATTISIGSFTEVMRGITPDEPTSHTSLYDMGSRTLLVTSLGAHDEYDDSTMLYSERHNGLYPAGDTDNARLNAAYQSSGVWALETGVVKLVDTGDRIVTTYTFVSTSGMLFGVVQSTDRSFYMGTLDQVQMIMIVVGVVAAVVAAAACLLLGVMIRSGLVKVKDNMQLAARLKTHRVVYTTSLLTEIRDLSNAFDVMNTMLHEAKAFMPQHMLLTTSSDEDDGNGELDEEGSLSKEGPGSQQSSQQSKVGADGLAGANAHHQWAAYDSSATEMTGTTTITAAHHGGKGAPAGPTLASAAVGSLAFKRVTLLAINVRGFHASMNYALPGTVAAPTMALTELIGGACNRHRGVIDAFHGDHFVLSFNAARMNAEGPVKAALCALELMEGGGANGRRRGEGPLRTYAMGLCSGKATVGHMGSATLKRLSIVGPIYGRAIALSAVCRRFNPSHSANANADVAPGDDEEVVSGATTAADSPLVGGVQCVTDAHFAAEVQHSFAVQALGGLSGGPFGAANAVVASKVQQRGRGAEVAYALRRRYAQAKESDEWLYEMQHSTSNPIVDVNSAVTAYLSSCAPPAPPLPPRGSRDLPPSPLPVGGDASAVSEARAALSSALCALREAHATEADPLFWAALDHAEGIVGDRHHGGLGIVGPSFGDSAIFAADKPTAAIPVDGHQPCPISLYERVELCRGWHAVQ